MAHQQAGTTVLLGQVGQGQQGAADALVAAAEDATAQEGHDRVDHQQPGVDPGDGPAQERGVLGQAQQLAAGTALAGQHEDSVQVGAQRLQAGPDGVKGPVLAVEDQGVARGRILPEYLRRH
jgi:hypothetical protein